MAYSPALRLQDRSTVYIEFCDPIALDDYSDPVYPYTPPTLAESITSLTASTHAASVRKLVLSVPHGCRSHSIMKGLVALREFLSSPACEQLETVQITGSTYLLNDEYILDTCAGLKTVKMLVVQMDSGNAGMDSYSLAAVLCAFRGVEKLRLYLRADMDVHKSFRGETVDTFRRLSGLEIGITGGKKDLLREILRKVCLSDLRKLEIVFDTPEWKEEVSQSLAEALGGSENRVLELVIMKKAGDTPFKNVCHAEALQTLLPPLIHLTSLSISSSSSQESLLLPNEVFDLLPSALSTLTLHNAYPVSPLGLLSHLTHRLCLFPSLSRVNLDMYISDEAAAEDEAEWMDVKTSSGHPATLKGLSWSALGMLADDLEELAISHNLVMKSEGKREERSYVSRGAL